MVFLKPVTILHTLPGGHVLHCQNPQVHYHLVEVATSVEQTFVPFALAVPQPEMLESKPELCQTNGT